MPCSQNNGTLNEAQTTSVDTIKVRQQSFFKRAHAYQIGPLFFPVGQKIICQSQQFAL